VTQREEHAGWLAARALRETQGHAFRTIADWLTAHHPELTKRGGGRIDAEVVKNHAQLYDWRLPNGERYGCQKAQRQAVRDPAPTRYRCYCGGMSEGRPVHEACERRTDAARANDWTRGGTIYGPASATTSEDAAA
jgi:hypothetical protein